jgi:cytochrome P450
MLAGSDTTSSATANILYFLISHPATYKRLQDGLGDKLTDCSAQAQLPYLNAVMYVALDEVQIFFVLKNASCSHEGLRVLPPVLSGVQRAAEKGSGGRMVGSL